jgi:translation initiation factor 5
MNINGSDDPFYRYKMPKLKSQSLSKNTTLINNLGEISKSLNRSTKSILKFMQHRISSACQFEKNSISGVHSSDKLQAVLQEYIDKYVLCPICGNPETSWKKTDLVCQACGKKSSFKSDPLVSKINNQ